MNDQFCTNLHIVYLKSECEANFLRYVLLLFYLPNILEICCSNRKEFQPTSINNPN